MKRVLVLYLLGLLCLPVCAQEWPEATRQQIESLGENGGETGDDQLAQELDYLRRHPLNLNTADADALRATGLLSEMQAEQLLIYRKRLGELLSIYELQAVPGWNPETIRRLLPFIRVGALLTVKAEAGKRLKDGEGQLLTRIALDRQPGADAPDFSGSPYRLLLRYTYRHKQNLQYGLTAEKDPGEGFFRGTQRTGFDFYSLHFFARDIGPFRAVALGDFTVNLGQGLLHWQRLSFRKSAELTAVKRQSPVLRPYHSTGEYNFLRGAAVTIGRGKWEGSFFVSGRKLDAGLITDTLNGQTWVRSVQTSGYHRTESELSTRGRLGLFSYGGNIRRKGRNWLAGLNWSGHQFSLPLAPGYEPYQFYSFTGKNWMNAGADYSYTWRNIHLFGEIAADYKKNPAFLQGLLMSLDSKADLSFLYRHIAPAYQTVFGSAFTENTMPENETGLFAGFSLRPVQGWRLDMYADVFRFPWIRYRADAPGWGNDYMLQVRHQPGRTTELVTRFRTGVKTRNSSIADYGSGQTVLRKTSWRFEISNRYSPGLSGRTRAEYCRISGEGLPESGFLFFTDIQYKPVFLPFSAGLRLQFNETDGYESRIYTFENDVLYSHGSQVSYGKNFRYYINIQIDIGKNVACWLRWAQTLVRSGWGAEAYERSGNQEIKLQFRYIFR